MDGYHRARERMINTLKCAGEKKLAKSISQGDISKLRCASQIYVECDTSSDISIFDINTVMMGMNILPKTPDDIIKIIENIREKNPGDTMDIDNIKLFIINPSIDTIENCIKSVETLLKTNYICGFVLLECVNIICEESENNSVKQLMDRIPVFSLSFV